MDQYQNKLLIKTLFQTKYKVKKEKPIKPPKKNNQMKFFKQVVIISIIYLLLDQIQNMPQLYYIIIYVIYQSLYIVILTNQISFILKHRRKNK